MLACSGCVEINSSQQSMSTLVGGMEITERTYLWGDEGPLTKKYDVRIWAAGYDIINLKGVSSSQMQSYVDQYGASQAQTARPAPTPTRESQSVVHTSIGPAVSSMAIVGDVYGFAAPSGGNINKITYTIALSSGSQPMDVSQLQITYLAGNTRDTLRYAGFKVNPNAGQWSITRVHDQVSNDAILYSKEKFELTIMPSQAIGPNTRFSISMQPKNGASVSLIRSTPTTISQTNILR